MKQDKYTRSAKGKPCQVRIPGVCMEAPEHDTTVFAHLNGGGMALKRSSIHGAYACLCCHAWLDGGYVYDRVNGQFRDLYHLEGVIRTQQIMIDEGVLEL